MATSIQVGDSTLKMLKGLKSETKARSYDQIILKLLSSRHKGESMFGFLQMKEDILKDLRDESDGF